MLFQQDATKKVELRTTPYKGQFRLYAGTVSKWQSLPPPTTALLNYWLEKGQRIGFMRDSKGQLIAVAGHNHRAVSGQSFSWTMQADSGQIDQGQTILLVVLIVVVAVAVPLIIWGVQSSHDSHSSGPSPI